jgi:signal transduction histidine kinase
MPKLEKQQKLLLNLTTIVIVPYTLALLSSFIMLWLSKNLFHLINIISTFIGLVFALLVYLKLGKKLETVVLGSKLFFLSLLADITVVSIIFGSEYPVYSAFIISSLISLYLFGRRVFVFSSVYGFVIMLSILIMEYLGYKTPFTDGRENNLITITVWGLIFLTVLALTIFENFQLRKSLVTAEKLTKKQEELLEKIEALAARQKNLRLQEKRKLRIQIHNSPIQDLTFIIKSLGSTLPSHAIEGLLLVVTDLRNIISDLEPENYKNFPVLVDSLIGRFQIKNKAINFHLKCEIDEIHLAKIPEVVKECAYHFIEETVTNAVKHADAKNIRVAIYLTLFEADYLFELVTSDDGKGMETKSNDQHQLKLGLQDLKWEIEMSGGEFSQRRTNGETVLALAFSGTLPVSESLDSSPFCLEASKP